MNQIKASKSLRQYAYTGLKDTLWEIRTFDIWGPDYDAMHASDDNLAEGAWRCSGGSEGRFLGNWPKIKIPTP